MRRLLSVLVVFLLIFTYSMPAYAVNLNENEDENVADNENSEIVQNEDEERDEEKGVEGNVDEAQGESEEGLSEEPSNDEGNEEEQEDEESSEEIIDDDSDEKDAEDEEEGSDLEPSNDESKEDEESSEEIINDNSGEVDSEGEEEKSNLDPLDDESKEDEEEESSVDPPNEDPKEDEKDLEATDEDDSNEGEDSDEESDDDDEVIIDDSPVPLGLQSRMVVISEVIDISPIFEGWENNGDGTFTAYFGYETYSTDGMGNPITVTLPRGNDNKINGNVNENLFPTEFIYPNVVSGRPGRTNWQPNAKVVIPDWDGSSIVWTLNGKTATAGLPNTAPEAKDVLVSGVTRVGETLTGEYTFYDLNNDTEDGSQFQWFMNGDPIVGENDLTLEVTEDMINQEISFSVIPVADEEPTTGDEAFSEVVIIEEPNLWLTVDDGYVLYINGVEVGEDPAGNGLPTNNSWRTIDYYYVEDTDVDDILIAVEGNDQGDGRATIAGLVLGYKDSNGDWLISDGEWSIFTNDDRTAPADYDTGESVFKWYEDGYRSNDWVPAHLIMNPDGNWPDEHPYLFDTADAKWIWSEDYVDEPFDSPVFFRTMIQSLPIYDEDADDLSVRENSVTDGDQTEAYIQLLDEDGAPFIPSDSDDYEVEFFLDGSSIGLGSYDSNGKYEIDVLPVYGEDNKVTATINGVLVDDEEYIEVTKAALEIEVTFDVDKNLIFEGEEVLVTITLIDQYDDPVENQDVNVKDDNDAPVDTDEDDPGVYTVSLSPALGINTITGTLNGDLIDDEEAVEVLGITTDIEHGDADEGSNDLDNEYEKLVLLAQMRTFNPFVPSNLRNKIFNGSENQLKNNNYSLYDDWFETRIETNPVAMPYPVLSGQEDSVEELPVAINYAAFEAGLLKDSSGEVIGSMDNVVIDYNDNNPKTSPRSTPEWHTVNYLGDFDNPVVIAQLSSETGMDHSHIRIKDVDPQTNTFKIFIEEWDEFRGTNHHNFELVSYLVVEAGVHTLDGGFIEAIQAVDELSFTPTTYEFSQHYDDPSVFSQVQSFDDENQVWMRQNDIQSKQVDVVKQNQETHLEYVLLNNNIVLPTDRGQESNQLNPYGSPHGDESIGIVVLADQLVMQDVVFKDADGGNFDSVTLPKGDQVDEPSSNPEKDGHSFSFWSLDDGEAAVPYDFNEEVLSDLVLFPHFEINTYTVSFNNTGETTVPDQSVDHGSTATKPVPDPIKEGYTFMYWGTEILDEEESMTFEMFDFDTPVEDNIDLYGVWELNSYEITFNSNGGSSVPSQMVEHGGFIEEPEAPTRSGFTFTGWTVDGSEVNFEWPVTGPMTLVAGWSSNNTGGGGGPTDTATINAVSDSFTITEGESLNIDTSDLLANDEDFEDFESVQDPLNGSVSLSGTTVTFTPDNGFTGRAYFYYTISDGADEDTAIVIVDVEEGVVIEEEITPLGSGNPNELIIIEPEITPLGAVDYSLPYILGYPDGTFRPERQVTRGEMAAIFARILGLTSNPMFTTNESAGEMVLYSDVASDDWYAGYIEAVSTIGLFKGYDEENFMPGRPVTHAEIAEAFSKYWELKDVSIELKDHPYSDIEGHRAEEMIHRLYSAGISVSYPDNTFRPDAFTTRTELVVMVNRVLNRAGEMKENPSFSDVLDSHWGYGAIEAATGYQAPESAELTE